MKADLFRWGAPSPAAIHPQESIAVAGSCPKAAAQTLILNAPEVGYRWAG